MNGEHFGVPKERGRALFDDVAPCRLKMAVFIFAGELSEFPEVPYLMALLVHVLIRGVPDDAGFRVVPMEQPADVPFAVMVERERAIGRILHLVAHLHRRHCGVWHWDFPWTGGFSGAIMPEMTGRGQNDGRRSVSQFAEGQGTMTCMSQRRRRFVVKGILARRDRRCPRFDHRSWMFQSGSVARQSAQRY